jgi:hypothetical protein
MPKPVNYSTKAMEKNQHKNFTAMTLFSSRFKLFMFETDTVRVLFSMTEYFGYKVS